jgi:DNA-binding HxlR family transcriptional regulator
MYVLPMTSGIHYGQFCPVARAAEILGERWTTLIVRELLCGSTRFNDLQRGVPRMSSSLLARRLKELEHAGIVARVPSDGGKGFEYRLSEAGRELFPVLERMGEWAQRWAREELTVDENLDPDLLMWDIRRNVTTKGIPQQRRYVVQFYFTNRPSSSRAYWLMFEGGEVEICYRDPGHDVDLRVVSDVLSMTQIWLGHETIASAVSAKRLALEGDPNDILAFRTWFALSIFAPAGRQLPGPSEVEPARSA